MLVCISILIARFTVSHLICANFLSGFCFTVLIIKEMFIILFWLEIGCCNSNDTNLCVLVYDLATLLNARSSVISTFGKSILVIACFCLYDLLFTI